MEVWQRMKLSFTNSSFGLILSLVNVHLYLRYRPSGYLSALKRSCGFVLTDVPVLTDLSCEPRGLTGRRALALAEQSSGTCPNRNRSIIKKRPVFSKPSGSRSARKRARTEGSARPTGRRACLRAVRRLGRSPLNREDILILPVHNKLRFAGLVAPAGSPHPIPSRTRP